MITSHKIHNKDGSYYVEYKGLSGDPKPVNVKEGDVFLELNTDSVFKFTSGKWTRIPENGKSSGGDYPEIDIIGTDKKLADLSAVALGFDLPDEPDEPDVVTTSTIDYEDPSWTKISDNMPFDINGLDVTDEDLYLNERGVILENPMVISTSLSPMTFKFIGASFTTDSTKTGHTCILDLYAPAGSDDAFTMSYFPFGDEENDIDPGLYWDEMPQGIPEETVITITQEGKKGRKNIGNEISSKYLESPIIDGTTEKLNAVKSVGVGYTKEGESVTVENDGAGERISFPMLPGVTIRKVEEESPFDYSGTEGAYGSILLTNPVRLSVDSDIPGFGSNGVTAIMNEGDLLIAGTDEEGSFFYFIDVKEDMSEQGFELEKGFYVMDTDTGEVHAIVNSLTQKVQDTIVKIDSKYISSPAVDGIDNDLLSAKKVGVGIDDKVEFVYSGDIEDYEYVQLPDSDSYYIKISDDPDMFDISGEGPTDGSAPFVFNKPITAIVGNGDDVHIPVETYALTDYSSVFGEKAFAILGHTDQTYTLGLMIFHDTVSEGPEMTFTKGIWAMVSVDQENPMVVDSIIQGGIIKIPEKYLPSTGADAIFAIGAGRVGFQVSIVSADYDSLYGKLITDGKPLNVMVYLTGAGGQSYRVLNVTRTEYNELDSEIAFFVDDFTGYAMRTYPMDFPGVIILNNDNTAQWTVDNTAEDFEIGFSANMYDGHQLLVSTGSYARLYALLSNNIMPNVKAYDMLNIEQIN